MFEQLLVLVTWLPMNSRGGHFFSSRNLLGLMSPLILFLINPSAFMLNNDVVEPSNLCLFLNAAAELANSVGLIVWSAKLAQGWAYLEEGKAKRTKMLFRFVSYV